MIQKVWCLRSLMLRVKKEVEQNPLCQTTRAKRRRWRSKKRRCLSRLIFLHRNLTRLKWRNLFIRTLITALKTLRWKTTKWKSVKNQLWWEWRKIISTWNRTDSKTCKDKYKHLCLWWKEESKRDILEEGEVLHTLEPSGSADYGIARVEDIERVDKT